MSDVVEWEGATSRSILELYGQQEYWIDRYGNQHLLTEMEDSYLWNVLNFMRRFAPIHIFQAALAELNVLNLLFASDPPTGLDDAWEESDRRWAEWEARPWESPLARAICAELMSRASYEGVFPHISVFTESEVLHVKRMGRI